MNLALSEEQELLREAARGTLARLDTVGAARRALDGEPPPALWPVAVEAGWPGLLVAEERGGAGLGAFEAMLVAQECGRVLAPVPLLGALPATLLLDAGHSPDVEAVAAGERRPVWLPVRPPDDGDAAQPARWTVEPHGGQARGAPPAVTIDGRSAALDGTVPWVPDAPGADLLVAVGLGPDGRPGAAVLEGGAAAIEQVVRYDASRSIGHVTLAGARGRRLDVSEETLERAWYLAQALLAAESVGATEAILEMAVEHARRRFTFGRPIGSYQAIKHGLTEVLRLLESARSLLLYAGWAFTDRQDEIPLATSAARAMAGRALEFAARQNIVTHGGIGATWEHDAPVYFRRAQLSRRLLGGTAGATDRVAGELLTQAAGTPA